MTSDFAATFAALKPVLSKYEKRLSVKADTPIEYTVLTKSASPFPQHKGEPLYFGSVRLGKAYENMMVDLMATSEKLVERSRRTVMTVTGVDAETAARAIEAAGKSVKTAIVMLEGRCTREEAEARLARAGGFVRAALGDRA